MRPLRRALREVTLLRVVLLVGLIILIGGGLTLLGIHLEGPTPSPKTGLLSANKLGPVLQQAGELMMGSSAIAILWELFVRRAFFEEVLEATNTSVSVVEAGLAEITFDFLEKIDWKSLLDNALTVDTLFSWAAGWREINSTRIRTIASSGSGRVRIVLPDPTNDDTMATLAQRFDEPIADVRMRIQSALDSFLALKGEFGGRIRVWTVDFPHTFSAYLIDTTAIFALYSHQRREVSVPAFVCKRPGNLYRYIRADFDSIVAEGGSGVER